MRTPARALFTLVLTLCATTVMVLAGAATATAATPTTWDDPEPTTHLHELLLYGGSLAGLIIGLIVFSLVLHRNHYEPPAPSDEVEKAPSNEAATH